jgi:methylmalonyl-CoA/ethylmalonyl-CoA epimerase
MQNGTDHATGAHLGPLDHVAILVRDTEGALEHFSGRLGLRVTHQERLEQPPVQLTWLDAGVTAIQLVQPLDAGSALAGVLAERGEGLHHLCFSVPDVREATRELAPESGESPVVQVRGQLASFVPGPARHGVLLECTQPDPSAPTAP